MQISSNWNFEKLFNTCFISRTRHFCYLSLFVGEVLRFVLDIIKSGTYRDFYTVNISKNRDYRVSYFQKFAKPRSIDQLLTGRSIGFGHKFLFCQILNNCFSTDFQKKFNYIKGQFQSSITSDCQRLLRFCPVSLKMERFFYL